MRADQALRLVDGLYAAALGESDWPTALRHFIDLFGSSAVTLEFQDLGQGRVVHFEEFGIDPAKIDIYIRDYGAINPRTKFKPSSHRCISHDYLFMTDDQMDKDAFYADFLAPSDLRYFISAESDLPDDRVCAVLAVQRSGRIRGAIEEHIAAMAMLAPHIDRATQMFWTRRRHGLDGDGFDIELASIGLTGAERRLAIALASGETLGAYAVRMGVTINTVYTHYRRVKDKFDCHRQVELLARLRGLCA
jgi:DNA-binding CsgD family transcriptional regulator